MSDKKNIERLFQEKFKDFEAIPSQKVWDTIEAELQKKKKRRVIPIWFRLSGVAALLLVGALIGYGILNNSPEINPTNGVVNQENNDLKNDNGKNLIPIKNNDAITETNELNDSNPEKTNAVDSDKNSQNDAVVNQEVSEELTPRDNNNRLKNKNTAVTYSQNKKTTSVKDKKKDNLQFTSENKSVANSIENKSENQIKNEVAKSTESKNNDAIANQESSKSKENQNPSLENNKIAVEKGITKTEIVFDTKALEEQKKDSTAVATVVPNPLEELLLEQEKEKQAVTETKVNRWQITSNVAPIYFSSASNGSPVSEEFSDNSKSYEKNLSYGVGINYALSDKWTVRSGVNKLTLGYNTNDIVYYVGLENATARNSNGYASKGTNIIVEDNSAVNVLSFDNVPGKTPGYLNQTMGYIEVPIELSYKILDKKFGIEFIGGMSTLFLNENNLSVMSNGYSVNAGKADNLNDVSFTSNIGLGFKYRFWKSFQANVEPKFKYQLNTFSENEGGFKPYFIGIYSGLSFSF